jgi:lipid-A-disaccharide synthase-like uncharacterized protein
MNFNSVSMWMALGFLGQAVFSSRFLLQWLASERAGRIVVPRNFWYLSIIGSVILLAYAIDKKDPVFILGQCAGFVIYLRNLHLLRRDEARTEVPPARA